MQACLRSLAFDPCQEPGKADAVVLYEEVGRLVVLLKQTDIELVFGNVDSDPGFAGMLGHVGSLMSLLST